MKLVLVLIIPVLLETGHDIFVDRERIRVKNQRRRRVPTTTIDIILTPLIRKADFRSVRRGKLPLEFTKIVNDRARR